MGTGTWAVQTVMDAVMTWNYDVEHLHSIGKCDAKTQPPMEKQEGNAGAEDTGEGGHLVGGNTGVAQPEDKAIFEQRVEQQGREIKGTFLGRTDQCARCDFDLIWGSNRMDVERHGATV